MSPQKLPAPLLPLVVLPAVLSSCAIGAYFSPVTAFERSVNGLYEGEGNGVTGRVPYRLTLTVQEGSGRVNGVLSNLESKKTYTGSGTFKRTPSGGMVDMNFFENGNKFRAAIHAELSGEVLTGRLRTVLLGQELFPYNISFRKVSGSTAP